MSSSADLIRPPSWNGLEPGLPSLVPAPPAVAAAVHSDTGIAGRVLTLGGNGGCGYVRLEPQDGGLSLFLKLVPARRRRVEERAQEIAAWLAARGIDVAVPCPGFPKPRADGGLIVAMPYLEGRRARPDIPDMSRLGGAMGRLHAALDEHPDRGDWASATQDRLALLEDVRADIVSGKLSTGPDPEALRKLAADGTLDFRLDAALARPLHGDLNPGNILVRLDDERPMLLDFEDVFHSVLPPIFELALVLERFVLIRCEDEPALSSVAEAFIEGYRCAIDRWPALPAAPSTVLRSLALRSLCVLALGEREGQGIGAGEWEKFFSLEALARARPSAVDQMLESAWR